jgi:hypothetical protein
MEDLIWKKKKRNVVVTKHVNVDAKKVKNVHVNMNVAAVMIVIAKKDAIVTKKKSIIVVDVVMKKINNLLFL